MNEEVEEISNEFNPNKALQSLGLSQSDIPTKAQLKKAYYKHSLRLHPDKHPNEYEKYDKLFKELRKILPNTSKFLANSGPYPPIKIPRIIATTIPMRMEVLSPFPPS